MNLLDPIYVESGGTATFLFSPVPVNSTTDTFEVAKSGEPAKIRVIYSGGTPATPLTKTNITFIGNEHNGNLSFTFSGIASSDKGQYILKNSNSDNLQCITLHILGKCLAFLDLPNYCFIAYNEKTGILKCQKKVILLS